MSTRRTATAVASVALALSLVGVAGCSSEDTTATNPAGTAASAVTGAEAVAAVDPGVRAEVEGFVAEAKAYAEANGEEAALATFTEPGGPFHRGELYIYAYNYDGKVIAHGGDASLVGQNLMDMTDPNGVKVIQELSALAESGSGWLEYTWPNPAAGNAEQLKLGYVEKVNDTWFLGSGIYPQT